MRENFDQDLVQRVQRRARALSAARAFFAEREFVEVETAQLVLAPGYEPHIDPLRVDVSVALHNVETRYLHTSPELSLKRAAARGLDRVYQIARVFRDGERTDQHLPEFTMVEWYRVGGTLDDLIVDVEELGEAVAVAVGGQPLPSPFRRFSIAELFARHADVDLSAALDDMADGDALALPHLARQAGHHLRPTADFEDAFFHIMGTRVEPALQALGTTVVERWPRQMAVLAKLCDDDDRYADRFEIYAQGLELANAFNELTDPVVQRERFIDDNRHRSELGKPQIPLDEAFLADLAHLPPTTGIALGFDRLLMAIVGATSIDDVIGLPW